VALSAEGRLADLQKQNAALKKELEKANAAPQKVQILTAQLAETNAQRDAQAAMQQLQTRALESELHKLKAKLAAPAPALALASSLPQRTQEESMRQMVEQLQDMPRGADPTSSARLHAALSRAEAAEAQLVNLQGHFNALLQVLSRPCLNNRD